jgi:hypothetical protein
VLEVADIFRRHGAAYRQKFASRLLPRHYRAMEAIERCRTAACGGHVFACDHCQRKLYTYHSCKNRHCPKCHGEQTRRWLDLQRARLLLHCPYFLLTFTLPSELRPLARAHPKIVYRLLMQAAAAALHKLARDPRYLGAATLGTLAVLHTWTRAMLFHPHVHLLVPAGGLSADRHQWLKPKNPAFLLPVRALSVLFRAKMRHRLRIAGLLTLVPPTAWSKPWVVHCQHAGSGQKVLDYLGRYVFRIAITNSRLQSLADDGTVRFHYRDNRGHQPKTATLSTEDFIARFLGHVLPKGFIKVRYSGLFSSSNRRSLEQARNLLALATPPTDAAPPSPPDNPQSQTPASDSARCPHCKVGRLVLIEIIPRPTHCARAKPP